MLQPLARSADFISRNRVYLVPLILGTLMPIGFSPFNLAFVSILVPAFFFAFLYANSPKKGLAIGFLFGIGMFGIGTHWVYVSMYRFGGVSLTLSIILTGLFVCVLAAFPAFVGYVYARFFRFLPQRLSLVVVMPALWVFFEWVRGWIFTGFPWLSLGYSQIDTPLKGFAPIVGYYGVSLVSAISAGLISLTILAPRKRWKFAVIIFLFIWGTGSLLSSIIWTHPSGQPIKVTLIQGNVSQDIKWLPAQRQPTIDLYLEKTRENWGSDLIIWPETALPAFYNQVGDLLNNLSEEAQSHSTDLLIGLPYKDVDSNLYYNTMILIGRNRGFYHKQHLVPFGEYIPLRRYLGTILSFLNVPMANFSQPTSDQKLLTVAGQKMGISICYEDIFGEEIIKSLPASTVLVNASNDAWFGESIAPHQHLQMARFRSLETGRPLLRATNTGITAIINDKGKLIEVAPQFDVATLTSRIQPMTGTTPYVKFGNLPLIILITTVLIVCLSIQNRLSKNRFSLFHRE